MKITTEQLASAFSPMHDMGEDVSDFIAADGTDIGTLLDSGQCKVSNPFGQHLADMYEVIRDSFATNGDSNESEE